MSGSLKIPRVFNQDPVTKLAVPSLASGQHWVLADSRALMTIKLDGICVKCQWSTANTKWELTQLHSNGMLDMELGRNFTEDLYIWDAFDKATVRGNGTFVLYGKDVNGNPHGLKGTFWAKMMPVVQDLVVARHNTKVKRFPGTPVQEFYDSIKMELEESPQIHGLVFHLEDEKLNTVSMAKVTKEDFGLPWPAPTTH